MEQQQEQLEQVTPTCKYEINTRIKHIKSGEVYALHLTPDNFIRLEGTGEPAYAYSKADVPSSAENPIWFRAAAEIEDETRYEFLEVGPAPGQPKPLTEEQQAAVDAFHGQMYNHFQPVVSAFIKDWDMSPGWDREKLIHDLQQAVIKNATDHFSELFEINVGQVWMIDHAGKGGIPVWIADHKNNIQVEVSTLFDIPMVDDGKPKMVEIEEVATHHVEGSLTNLVIKAMRPSDAADGPDRFDFYDIHGFTTEGFGGRQQRQGMAITFQTGNPAEVGATGVTIEALLAVCLHRLEQINVGDLECVENTTAAAGIVTALGALKQRQVDRIEDGTIGTQQA